MHICYYLDNKHAMLFENESQINEKHDLTIMDDQ